MNAEARFTHIPLPEAAGPSPTPEAWTGPYHLRFMTGCILAGETEGGGLDIVMPVAGLMMGMALRARVAEGWWSLSDV